MFTHVIMGFTGSCSSHHPASGDRILLHSASLGKDPNSSMISTECAQLCTIVVEKSCQTILNWGPSVLRIRILLMYHILSQKLKWKPDQWVHPEEWQQIQVINSSLGVWIFVPCSSSLFPAFNSSPLSLTRQSN